MSIALSPVGADIARRVAAFHGVEPYVAERIIDAYLDPDGGEAHLAEASAERDAERAARIERLALHDAEQGRMRVVHPSEEARRIEQAEALAAVDADDVFSPCPEWCIIAVPEDHAHPLSPGGRIGLAEVIRCSRQGSAAGQSNRTGHGYIASATAEALHDRGLIAIDPNARIGMASWRPTILGVALHEAIEEGR